MNKRLRLYAARWVYFKTYYQEMRNLTKQASGEEFDYLSHIRFFVLVLMDIGRMDILLEI